MDIPTGAGRELNLELEPFNFPPPLDAIDDWVTGYRPRKMALWSREQIEGRAAALISELF